MKHRGHVPLAFINGHPARVSPSTAINVVRDSCIARLVLELLVATILAVALLNAAAACNAPEGMGKADLAAKPRAVAIDLDSVLHLVCRTVVLAVGLPQREHGAQGPFDSFAKLESGSRLKLVTNLEDCLAVGPLALVAISVDRELAARGVLRLNAEPLTVLAMKELVTAGDEHSVDISIAHEVGLHVADGRDGRPLVALGARCGEPVESGFAGPAWQECCGAEELGDGGFAGIRRHWHVGI
mmetsp:Transcript_13471/g.39754  ORF Transcript_13471/g.39754 Transcript_13471/m.39754 type:complete len:242 (-) Transcript_13471:116-841(-)